MPKIVPVVLCGGSGTRLWPRSRASMPKPFIPLLSDKTLFEATLERCGDRSFFAAPCVVIGEKHLEFAKPQAAALAPDARFIVEPMGRNTAPAIALAALTLEPQEVMLVCPSDHHIVDPRAFREAARAAAELASEDHLVAFGIEATAPETGYGYLRRGNPLGTGFEVHSFVEKPDQATALSFLADGGYAWNGGIFAFRAGCFLDELAKHRPHMANAAAASYTKRERSAEDIRPDADSFAAITAESVDYAVMENTDSAAMVDVSMGWSDIGNWVALREACASDDNGNVAPSSAELIDCRNVMVESDGPRVSVVGLENVTIVVSNGEILVTSDAGAQKVGNLAGAENRRLADVRKKPLFKTPLFKNPLFQGAACILLRAWRTARSARCGSVTNGRRRVRCLIVGYGNGFCASGTPP